MDLKKDNIYNVVNSIGEKFEIIHGPNLIIRKPYEFIYLFFPGTVTT